MISMRYVAILVVMFAVGLAFYVGELRLKQASPGTPYSAATDAAKKVTEAAGQHVGDVLKNMDIGR
jgi:hypothetical protein